VTALRVDGGPVVIGEVAQAHDGSLNLAHAFVDVIADAGADAVKFQTHIAAAETTPAEEWRVRFSHADDTRYEYWRRMEFTEEQWAGLRKHADDRGIAFISSPFSLEAISLLERVGVAAWKIASGETSNVMLLDRVAGTGLPVLISTGMSPWIEIDAAVARVRAAGTSQLVVLQCTSEYPTTPDRVGLNIVTELRQRYDCPSGLSDHSGTIYPGLAAVALGATVLEVHVTMSPDMPGPDVPASLTPGELRMLVEGAQFIAAANAAPVAKDEAAAALGGMRALFTRSVVAARDLVAGTELSKGDLALKKPGGGLPAARLAGLVGHRLTRELARDEQLSEGDVT